MEIRNVKYVEDEYSNKWYININKMEDSYKNRE